MNGFPDAVIARSAAGPDPRKPDFPEVGVIRLVSVAGTERVIVTALDARGNLDPQEYYITLQDVVNLSGSGGALTSSSAEGITTVKPSLNTDNLQLQSPDKIILDVALISLVGGGTGPGADVSFLGADVTAGQHSAELDFITGNATGAGGITGPLYLGSGNSAADVSGLVSLGSGTAGTTSGEADLFTGDASTTGPVNIQSGNASAGDSGNVLIQTGTATGTRGSIIIDAPSVLFPGAAGALLTAQTAPAYLNTAAQTGSTVSQWAGIGSGDSVDGDGGGAEIYTGNTSGSGNTGSVNLHSGDANATGATGPVNIYSGNAAGGNSGDISLQTGTASGTRGNIVLNMRNLSIPGNLDVEVSGSGFIWMQTPDGQSFKSGNVGGMSGSPAAGFDSGDTWFGTGDVSGANSGLLGLQSGGATNGNSGAINLVVGNADGAGKHTGDILLHIGNVTNGAVRGNIVLDAADIVGPAAPARLHLGSQTATGSANSGNAGIESGDATASTGNSGNAFLGTSDAGGKSGDVNIYTGASNGSGQSGGSINITTGGPTAGDANGGDISIIPANGVGTGRAGQVLLLNIPTADPHVVGALWIDAAAGRAIKSSNG